MQHCSSYAAPWVWLQQSSESLLSDHKSILVHVIMHLQFLTWCILKLCSEHYPHSRTFPSLRFPCSAQCWSVCIPSKAVIIAEHQAVLDWAKDRGVLRNLSRGLAWAGEDSWNSTQYRISKARSKKFSIVWGAHHDRVWAVSFPHIYLLSLSLLWHVGVCCAQSQAGCVDWCGLITPDLQTHRPKPDRDLFTSQT